MIQGYLSVEHTFENDGTEQKTGQYGAVDRAN